jgi:hypothetical protein
MVRSFQSYVIATRRGRAITDSFIIGNNAGWFCPHCPTVVIDKAEIERLLVLGQPQGDAGQEFAVLGLVNLAAIPLDKQHVPMGDDDNPIPLVEFTVGSRPPAPRSQVATPSRQPSRRKKRRR